MSKNVLALLALCAASAFAGVEINSADQATLESVKGIGTGLSDRILAERTKAPFNDWAELMRRVKGIRAASAAKLSAAGVTVNGAPYPDTANVSGAPINPASAARRPAAGPSRRSE
jgi:competence protein ComEA